jgi:hypothetical protein
MVYFSVGFEVLTAAGMKTAIFWVVAPCSLVDVEFERSLLPPSSETHRPDDGGSKDL